MRIVQTVETTFEVDVVQYAEKYPDEFREFIEDGGNDTNLAGFLVTSIMTFGMDSIDDQRKGSPLETFEFTTEDGR